MNRLNRQRLRLASRIHQRLTSEPNSRLSHLHGELNRATNYLEQLTSLQRRLELCQHHRFTHSAARVSAEIIYPVMDLTHVLSSLQRAANTPAPPQPSLKDIFDELAQLEDEFEEYHYATDSNVLSVKTDRIELEGIDLGRFRIELHLPQLDSGNVQSALKIVALDPNPATTNEEVTHPHVSGEALCTGEATSALEASMAAGRIADVFILIRSVLNTYNPGSPYVALKDWSGRACSDCGYAASEDECYLCEHCDDEFCSECISSCSSCDVTICQGCLVTCRECDERVCKNCLQTCNHCGRALCRSCKVDGLCPTCIEEKEKQDEQEQSEESSHPAEADVG